MARPQQRGAGGDRRSWRAAAPRPRGRPPALRPWRWLFTLAALALLGGFAYFLWPRPWGQRHLVAIPIWATHQLAVPPLPYASEDLAGLRQLRDGTFHGSLGLQHAASFAGLDRELQQLRIGRKDILILYLCAHGVAEDGQALVLCSDYLDAAGEGRRPLRDLLLDVASGPAQLKLLVLDSGRLGYDPRLGLAVNEFPRLAADAVRDLPAQELWVLLPNAALETTVVSHPQRRSVFGRAVAEALAGQADRWPEDRFVSLYELYRYVFCVCDGWYPKDTGARHTPLLLQAGRGVVQPTEATEGDKPHRLTWVPPLPDTPPEPPPASEPAKTSSLPFPRRLIAGAALALAETPPAAEAADTGPRAANVGPSDSPARKSGEEPAPQPTEKPAAKPPEKPAAPAAAPPDTNAAKKPPAGDPAWADFLTLLDRAWTLRDQVQTRSVPDGRSPFDFAPHLWRELEARLLAYEQRSLSGAPVDALEAGEDKLREAMRRITADLGALVQDLQQLQTILTEDRDAPSERWSTSIGSRLAKAWNRYRQDALPQAEPSAAGVTDSLRTVIQDVRRCRHLVFRCRDAVRWYARASLSSSRYGPVQETLGDLEGLLTGLRKYQATIVELQRRPITAGDVSLLEQAIDEFAGLEQLQRSLEKKLGTLAETALAEKDQPWPQQVIEDLLSTPLLEAPRRRELVTALWQARPPEVSPELNAPLPEVGHVSLDQWQRAAERVRLEELLLRLGDAAAADLVKSQGELIDPLTERLRGGEDVTDDLWRAYRRLGSLLRDGYVGLPAKAATDSWTLYLVDARDAARVREDFGFPAFRIEVKVPAQMHLAGPAEERLEQRTPKTLAFTVSATQPQLLDRAPQLTCDARWVSVSDAPEIRPLPDEGGWFRKTYTWQVTAKVDQETSGQKETPLRATLQWSDGAESRQATHTVNLTLPQPNRIDLEIIRVGGTVYAPDQGATVPLALYPNRKTQYQFSLVNRSGQTKQVEAALYAVPRPEAALGAPGKIDRRTRQMLIDEVTQIVRAKRVAKTAKPLALPADAAERAEIPWVAADAPAPPKPEEGAKPPPAPPATAPPAVDVSYGLVCVITEVGKPRQPWIKWLELAPLAPRRYLEPEIGYDTRQERIVVRLGGKDFDGDDRPDLPPGDPVQVVWRDELREIPEGAKKRLSGPLPGNPGKPELYAAVPPDGKTRLVNLTVDGDPRAIVYQVPCGPATGSADFLPGSDVRRTACRVRINRLQAADYPVVFHLPPYVSYPAPDQKPTEEKQVRVATGERVVVPAPCRGLRVDLEVDAPVDAFQDPNHRIEVMLGERLTEPQLLSADRHCTIRLTSWGERGLLEFETEVGDFVLPLLPGDLQNAQTYVEANLLLPGVGEATDYVRLELDADKPVIQRLDFFPPGARTPLPRTRAGIPIAPGTALVARLQVQDFAGPRDVEFGWDKEGKGQLPPEPAKREAGKLTRSEGLFEVAFPVETAELKPGSYTLVLRVTDLANHPSDVQTQRIVVQAPPPVRGQITGQIRFGPAAVNGLLFSLTLEDGAGGVRNVEVASDGSFLIPDLAPGAYTLRAKGAFQGKTAEGELKNVQPAPPGQGPPIVVPVHRPEPRPRTR